MKVFPRGKTIAERAAEKDKKHKPVQQILTVAQRLKVEKLRQKVVEMSKAGSRIDKVETR